MYNLCICFSTSIKISILKVVLNIYFYQSGTVQIGLLLVKLFV